MRVFATYMFDSLEYLLMSDMSSVISHFSSPNPADLAGGVISISLYEDGECKFGAVNIV